MKPVRILRHVEWEGPGYLGEVLERAGVPYDVVAVDADEPVPSSVDDISGLVSMGGPMSANDALPWIADELALLRRAAEAGIPLLGHCLGAQLIARALGAMVRPNPVKEIGWYPVMQLETDAAGEWLADVPAEFEAFHWHSETFSLPAGAHALLKSEWCMHQGFARGNVLGLQCHLEVTEPMIHEWVARYGDELEGNAGSIQRDDALSLNWSGRVQGPDSLRADLDQKLEVLHRVADAVYGRWMERLPR